MSLSATVRLFAYSNEASMGRSKMLRTIKNALICVAILFTVAGQVEASIWTFTNAGASGQYGPTQALVDAAYASTNLNGLVTSSSGIQSWSIPTTGNYRITAWGAQGASGDSGHVGGWGAMIAGDFTLTAGQVIQVAVGQMGIGQSSGNNGGGGGGSFVVDASNSPFLIAGGGGGTRTAAYQNGHPGQISQYGTTGSGSTPAGGGVLKTIDLGLGGRAPIWSWGSGGAGFFGNGANDYIYGTGGMSWSNGLVGGARICTWGNNAFGGFGGGGAGNGSYGGGGGGGYSGGDGGFIAGGAGSYNTGINQLGIIGYNEGYGEVQFELLGASPIPEPSTLVIWSILGGLGLIVARHRRKQVA
jgi:hypothetical protein